MDVWNIIWPTNNVLFKIIMNEKIIQHVSDPKNNKTNTAPNDIEMLPLKTT